MEQIERIKNKIETRKNELKLLNKTIQRHIINEN